MQYKKKYQNFQKIKKKIQNFQKCHDLKISKSFKNFSFHKISKF